MLREGQAVTERERGIVRSRAVRALNTVLARKSGQLGRVRVIDPDKPDPAGDVPLPLRNHDGGKRAA